MWFLTGNEDLVFFSIADIKLLFYLSTSDKNKVSYYEADIAVWFHLCFSFECFFYSHEAITFLHRRKPLAEQLWPATTSHFIGPMKYSVH